MPASSYRRKAEHPVRDALILSGVILGATVAVILVGPQDHVSQEVLALLAGLALGVWLLRFSPSWRWLAMLVLVLSLVLWLVLGPAGIAWFGGFIAGSQAGLAWQHAKKRSSKPAKPSRQSTREVEWLVDRRRFGTAPEAREAALAALRSLDGKSRGRLAVEYGSARFEVAGGVGGGMVCHRNADATNEGSWAVLARSEGVADESVEVPMGAGSGYMPAHLVHDVTSVEIALEEFLKNPESSSFGPGWVTGNEAEGTRLTT